MAFPTRDAVGTGNDPSAGTTSTIAIPAPSSGDGAGDIILIHYNVSGLSTGVTKPAAFAQLQTYVSASQVRAYTWWVRDDGTLGGTNVTATKPANAIGAWVVQRWRGCHLSTNPAVGSASGSYGASADPSTVTPAWGAEDNTWVIVAALKATKSVTYPAGYTANQSVKAATDTQVNSASRENNASSENPAAFTWSGSTYYGCWAIGLRPSAVTPRSQVIWVG